MLQVKIADPKARPPQRQSATDISFVLHSCERLSVPPKSTAKVRTGILIGFPEGFHGRIFSIPSIVSKYLVEVTSSIITTNATSKVHINIFNHSDETFEIVPGDRIAKMVIEKTFTLDVVQVDVISHTASKS